MKRLKRTLWAGVIATTIASTILASAHGAEEGTSATLARVISYSISPSGDRLAEVVAGGSILGGRTHIIVRGLKQPMSSVRTIYAGEAIGPIYWLNDSTILFSVTQRAGSLVEENIRTKAHRTILRSHHAITIAAFDRQHGLLAYQYFVPWKWGHRVSVRMTDRLTVEDLIAPAWARWPEIQVLRAIRFEERRGDYQVRQLGLRLNRVIAPFPATVAWRHGALIAFVSAMHRWRTRIYDLESGQRIDRNLPFFRILMTRMSRSGALAVEATHLWQNRVHMRCGCGVESKIYVLNGRKSVRRINAVSEGGSIWSVGGIWWAGRDRLYLQLTGAAKRGGAMRSWLEELNTRDDRVVRRYYWRRGDLGGGAHPCDFDARRSRAICIAQSLTEPPELVELNLATGMMRPLGKIDPGEHRLDFQFKTIRIPTRFGEDGSAFLAVPPREAKHPVPLAVMAYGFSEAYSRDAQWITSYPVAKMVAAGIAVLLVNWANTGYQRGPSPSFQAMKRAQESAVSLLANAVPAVRASGVRVSRAMVMGWSFGGLFAAHAIQSLHEYVAAQVGDPAGYNVMEYGLANAFWRNIALWNFGGPPVGKYLANYQYMDPAGNGRAANGPILFEFVSRNLDAGQFLQEWRAVGTDVEAFAYRKSVHWLSSPAEASVSRLRNLYWAELNLLGPQSVSAAELRSVGLTIPWRGWWETRHPASRPKLAEGSHRCPHEESHVSAARHARNGKSVGPSIGSVPASIGSMRRRSISPFFNRAPCRSSSDAKGMLR